MWFNWCFRVKTWVQRFLENSNQLVNALLDIVLFELLCGELSGEQFLNVLPVAMACGLQLLEYFF